MATTSPVVSVTFLGVLRRVAGHREMTLAMDADATVSDLLQALVRACGRDFDEAVFRAPGEVHTYLRVFVNEEEARMTDRVAPAGSAADVAVLVMPGFEGGR